MQTVTNKVATSEDKSIQAVLEKVCALYGLWSLEKHIPVLTEGGFIKSPNFVRLLNEAILNLCSDLKTDAVALVDVISVDDAFNESILGQSDGQVYQHLKNSFMSHSNTFEKPVWCEDILNLNNYFKSKI